MMNRMDCPAAFLPPDDSETPSGYAGGGVGMMKGAVLLA